MKKKTIRFEPWREQQIRQAYRQRQADARKAPGGVQKLSKQFYGELFGEQLLAARTAAGLTQVETAALLGVAQPRIPEWEKGRFIPGRLKQERILEILSQTPRKTP